MALWISDIVRLLVSVGYLSIHAVFLLPFTFRLLQFQCFYLVGLKVYGLCTTFMDCEILNTNDIVGYCTALQGDLLPWQHILCKMSPPIICYQHPPSTCLNHVLSKQYGKSVPSCQNIQTCASCNSLNTLYNSKLLPQQVTPAGSYFLGLRVPLTDFFSIPTWGFLQ